MKIIILAGGSGTRLWPISRGNLPKQFVKVLDQKMSLFQESVLRSLDLVEIKDVIVVTNVKYRFLVESQIEELGKDIPSTNIIVEPMPKNTLAAICAGVFHVGASRKENIIVLPSDHKIINNQHFSQIIKESLELTGEYIVTFGIKPTHSHTGYGYISLGESFKNAHYIKEFVEKPNKTLAESYINQGYLWNAGIFLFNTNLFLEEVKSYSPDIYDAFNEASSFEEAFSHIKYPISIDYGVIEKSSKVCVVKADIDWSDLGNFEAYESLTQKDSQGNTLKNDSVFLDSHRNHILSNKNKLIAMINVDELVVIDTDDVLVISKKGYSQRVKEVVDHLNIKKDERVHYHLKDYRPWGHYQVIDEQKNQSKVKRITVQPGKRLSYQKHEHRSEHWIVVKGIATVLIDDVMKDFKPGENVFISVGQKHRLINNTKTQVEIIEVQYGEILDESDIIRIEDEYGRK